MYYLALEFGAELVLLRGVLAQGWPVQSQAWGSCGPDFNSL